MHRKIENYSISNALPRLKCVAELSQQLQHCKIQWITCEPADWDKYFIYTRWGI